MNQIEFLKQKEQRLINAVGEDEWYDQKVYDVDEVAEFMKEHTNAILTSLLTRIEELPTKEYKALYPEDPTATWLNKSDVKALIKQHLTQ